MKKILMGLAAVAMVAGTHSALAEDPYIQSKNNNLIVTDYFINKKTKIEIDFQMSVLGTDTSYQMRIFGQSNHTKKVDDKDVVDSDCGNCAVIYFGDTARNFKVGYGNTFNGAYLAPCDKERHTIVYDGPGNICTFSTAGVQKGSAKLTAAHDATARHPMVIFGESISVDGSICDAWAFMRLYGMKVYEDGELVRNYIPAKKDGVVGVWDTVNEKFLGSQVRKGNTGADFKAVGAVYEVPGDPYLESDGTTGINTGVYAQPGLKVEVDYQFTDASDPTPSSSSHFQQRIVAVDNNGSYPRLSAYINGSGYIALTTGNTWLNTNHKEIKADLLRHTLVLDSVAKKSRLITCGVVNQEMDMVDAITKNSLSPISLFAGTSNQDGSTFNNKGKMRIYRAKFWVNDTLIRDFVPAIANGQAGLNDLVRGGFYAAEVGNKTAFTAGNIAKEDDLKGAPYIENNGTFYSAVNTYYFANPKTRVEVDYQLTRECNGTIVAGQYNDNTLTSFLYVNADGKLFPCIRDGNWSQPAVDVQRLWNMARHKLVLDHTTAERAIYDLEGNLETKATTEVSITKTAGRPFLLFASAENATGKSRQVVKGCRIYGCKIWEKEDGEMVLKHDFKPFVKGDTPGFKDAKTGFFHAGDGLTYGGEIDRGEDDPYIESPYGNRSIDTGYYATANTSIVCDYMPLVQQNAQQFPCEAGDSVSATNDNKKMFLRWYGNGSTGQGDWAWSYGGQLFQSTGVPYAPHVRRQLTMDRQNMKIKVETLGLKDYEGEIASWALVANKSSTTLKLFANGNGTGNVAKGRLYGFQIYESGVLKRNYKPIKVSGLTALKDEVTGEVLGWTIASAATPPTECGGPIEELDAERGTLYLEGDGSYTVNTGYKAKGNSRIEIDFAYTATDNGKVLAGVWSVPTGKESDALLRYAPWHDTRKTRIIFSYNKSSQRDNWPTADVNRHTVVMDFKNKKLQYKTLDSVVEQTFTDDVGWKDSTVCNIPMGVFGTFKDVEATVSDTMRAAARIYGIKVYEDNVLVHEFVPAENNGAATLYDLNDKVYAAVVKFTDGAALKLGGIGYGAGDEKVVFLEQPQSQVILHGEVATLKANVPGAIAYQWFRNGEPVEGATEPTLQVAWWKGRGEETKAVFTVKATCSQYGQTIEVESDPATVESQPRGMTLIVK